MSIHMHVSKVTDMVRAKKFREIRNYDGTVGGYSTLFIMVNREIEKNHDESEWMKLKTPVLKHLYAKTMIDHKTMFIWSDIMDYFKFDEHDRCLRLLQFMDSVNITALDRENDYMYFMNDTTNYTDTYMQTLCEFAMFVLSNDVKCITIKPFVFEYVRTCLPYLIKDAKPHIQLLFI